MDAAAPPCYPPADVWTHCVLRRLRQNAALQAVTAQAVGAYLAFALRTTRWTLVGEAHLAAAIAGAPVIATFWHDRLPLIPALWPIMQRRGATGTPHVLISKHRDGRFIAAIVQRFGVRVVHGSSSKNNSARDMADKGAVTSVRALLGILAAGEHILITPDGPRGPARRAAPGVAQIAALSGVPVLPMAAQTTRARRLPTWDRTILPLPFGRGVIAVGAPMAVPRRDWAASLPAIEAALDAVADEADRLCAR